MGARLTETTVTLRAAQSQVCAVGGLLSVIIVTKRGFTPVTLDHMLTELRSAIDKLEGFKTNG